ncbi:hypothetical protein BKA66DRAFT_552505 [Pyrenochaeta sp. MPI-SDFR-AT-0127]|nr:hypothetical protein BKA66DRAFT_552505 [Pyrenochaeta sp. MPI-SDFR-AT-0127]
MRLFLISLLAVAVSASPFAFAEPQASLVPTPISADSNRTQKNVHKEPTPVFKLPCDCAQPIIPMNLLSTQEKCLMKHAAAMGCYIKSNGACASPAPACGLSAL